MSPPVDHIEFVKRSNTIQFQKLTDSYDNGRKQTILLEGKKRIVCQSSSLSIIIMWNKISILKKDAEIINNKYSVNSIFEIASDGPVS